jgi:hypothetical protein
MDCNWFETNTRRYKLGVFNSGASFMRVNFAGRGWKGVYSCTLGSDPYVAYAGLGNDTVCGVTLAYVVATVDVWQALLDGVWSGSTTIQIAGGSVAGCKPYKFGNPTPCGILTGLTPGTCLGGTASATVTITENGSLSIA